MSERDTPWTPRPWAWAKEPPGPGRLLGALTVYRAEHWICGLTPTQSNAEADARLIAAAPEMAELLLRVMDVLPLDPIPEELASQIDILVARIWPIEVGNP